MGYKTSKDQRNALALRAETIGLDAAIAHECRSNEQQDIILEFQEQVGAVKILNMSLSARAPQKPTRDYEAAQQKLDDLIRYASGTYDKATLMLLSKVQLRKVVAKGNQHRNWLRDKVEEELNTIGTSKARTELLVKSLMQYFDEYEPTEIDHIIMDGFITDL